MQVSELFMAIVDWATEQGAVNIDRLPDVWRGQTDEYLVIINGQKEERENVPVMGISV